MVDRPEGARGRRGSAMRPAARKAPPGGVAAGTTAQPHSGSVPAGTSGPTKGTVEAGGTQSLVTERFTWGLVESYAVDDEQLRIKLNTGAIGRNVVWVGVDEPHFRTAVSMAMMAFHTPDTKLTVRYAENRIGLPTESNVIHALEIGIGNDPSEALAFDEWLPLA